MKFNAFLDLNFFIRKSLNNLFAELFTTNNKV